MKIPRLLKFNGKIYRYASSHRYKTLAEMRSGRWRSNANYLSRVVKINKRWLVYVRGKRGRPKNEKHVGELEKLGFGKGLGF